ncbi:MAG: type II toxin-antitoxin system HicB family antitoxin [Chloroflexota bacterium]|nr:type II toxin-antitoxin system HicB family antitoxin [Chloroflexota bacterium]
MTEYPIIVFWSDEDDAYIADVPDIHYCSAHGRTPEEAVREVRIALASMLEWMKEEGVELPPPTLRPTLRAAS